MLEDEMITFNPSLKSGTPDFSSGGVSLTELVKQTGWQPHSVRGFFRGTIGKKMVPPVESFQSSQGRSLLPPLRQISVNSFQRPPSSPPGWRFLSSRHY
jgi:hypothetical protein